MLRLAFRNLTTNKSRTLLAMAALVIGVITIVSLISVTAGMRSTFTDIMSDMTGIWVYEKDAMDVPFSVLPVSYGEKIESIPGVKLVIPQIWGMASEVNDATPELEGGISMGLIAYVGTDAVKERLRKGDFMGVPIEKGRMVSQGETHTIVLGYGIADSYNRRLGSKIEIDDVEFTVVGIYEESLTMDNYFTIPLKTARDMRGLDADEVSNFEVQASDSRDEEKISAKIRFKFDDVEALTMQEAGDEMTGMLDTLDLAFILISMIALVIAGVGIINTMLMSVLERQKEIGVLKAVGWTSDDILKLVLWESLMIGIGGGLIGNVIGFGVVAMVNPILPFEVGVTPIIMVQAMLFAMAAGLFGGVYPAWKISKIDPIEAMRS
ncbi:MAG: ABC transporter permease [Candidatus Diapherotrites archaeon]|nr:ABC transporter permease [Candidatus Diapherotrites archaeon]